MAAKVQEVEFTDMIIAISNISAAIDARNEIDCKRLLMDEKREEREWKFKVILLFGVLILAGAQVVDLIGLI